MTSEMPDPRPMIEWARTRLDEAFTAMVEHEETAGVYHRSERVAAAHAMATIAQAAALLQPTPEEVLALYEGVATEVDDEAAGKLEEVHAILVEAKRDGSRRHPAIIAAVQVIEGR